MLPIAIVDSALMVSDFILPQFETPETVFPLKRQKRSA
jgi:hypothetical protein